MKRSVVLALLVLVAVVIPISSPCLSFAEEIRLSTIVPDQTVLRSKKGAIGNTYCNPVTVPTSLLTDPNPSAIPPISDVDLLVEGNVGIGTASPGAKLEVSNGNVLINNSGQAFGSQTTLAFNAPANTASRLNFIQKDIQDWSLVNDYFQDNTDKFTFEYKGAPKVTLDNNGNVGIGTTSPSATLEVKGTMKVFGAWETKSVSTVYQAPTDGFVSAIGTTSTGFTDGNNPPTTQRTSSSNFDGQCFMPVRKGDYWKVTMTSAGTVYWIPLGS